MSEGSSTNPPDQSKNQNEDTADVTGFSRILSPNTSEHKMNQAVTSLLASSIVQTSKPRPLLSSDDMSDPEGSQTPKAPKDTVAASIFSTNKEIDQTVTLLEKNPVRLPS